MNWYVPVESTITESTNSSVSIVVLQLPSTYRYTLAPGTPVPPSFLIPSSFLSRNTVPAITFWLNGAGHTAISTYTVATSQTMGVGVEQTLYSKVSFPT